MGLHKYHFITTNAGLGESFNNRFTLFHTKTEMEYLVLQNTSGTGDLDPDKWRPLGVIRMLAPALT